MLDLAVVIPAFNAQSTIVGAIRSAQDAGADQIIVVDDGSTDATSVVAAAAGARVIRQPNQGAAAARRRGAEAVENTHVVLLDADDRLIPGGVETSIEILEENDSCVLAGGRTIGVGRGGAERPLAMWPEDVSTESLLARGHAPGPPGAFVWRSRVLREVLGDTPPGLWPRYAEDFEFLIRATLLGQIIMHETSSCRYAWVGGKSSKSPEASIRDAEAIRLHYAAIAGHAVRARTPNAIQRMIYMRRSSEFSAARHLPERIWLTVRAVVSEPRFFTNKIMDRVGRRVRSVRNRDSLSLLATIREDWVANPRDPKSRMILILFRLSRAAMGESRARRVLAAPLEVLYRVVTEGLLGVELRPKTQVGPGLAIFHGFGMVVNDHAKIGRGVQLRNGVTIGHQKAGGGCPVIGDRVSVGAGAIILGDIQIGEGATIGAGAVVVRSVAPGDVVAGNPARSILGLDRPSMQRSIFTDTNGSNNV